MKFRLLGPLEVLTPQLPTTLGGPQQRTLLAMLLLNVGKVVSTWDLRDEMWPKRAESVRLNTLHAQVARLRSTLTANGRRLPLYNRSGGYILNVDPKDVDVAQFHQLRRRGVTLATTDPTRAGVALREALSLWRGSALQDSALGKRCQAAAIGLNELRLRTHEALADIYLQTDEPAAAIDELQELASLHPMRETLLARLMAALHAYGRGTEALQLYAEARARFDDKLGCEPGEAMREQHLRILGARSS